MNKNCSLHTELYSLILQSKRCVLLKLFFVPTMTFLENYFSSEKRLLIWNKNIQLNLTNFSASPWKKQREKRHNKTLLFHIVGENKSVTFTMLFPPISPNRYGIVKSLAFNVFYAFFFVCIQKFLFFSAIVNFCEVNLSFMLIFFGPCTTSCTVYTVYQCFMIFFNCWRTNF